MNNVTILSLLTLVFLATACIAGCTGTTPASDSQHSAQVQTAPQGQNSTQNYQNGDMGRFGGYMKEMVQNLSARGYDMTQIKAAVDKGDNQTAFKLLNQFWDQHPETRPPMPPMAMERIKQSVANLTAKGYDTAQIQAAVDSGDANKASTALNQFWQAHPEARPTFTADPAQLKSRIDQLRQQGVDVSAIETAYDSGDMNKTRDLIRQASPRGSRGGAPGQ